ncbi:MAG: MFS transporter [Clostridia bacterium]|nr:MFS transporter [Clostridia bacterium]
MAPVAIARRSAGPGHPLFPGSHRKEKAREGRPLAGTVGPAARRGPLGGVAYKWVALSNTTLGVLMASINATIVMISLPMIFRGIGVNPLAPGQTGMLLWVLMGYQLATTILLVTFGRISDGYGRVRLYNLGFVLFTLGSILASLTWGRGAAGEIQLIAFRMIQGIGGAFLFANSAAILTDAFPPQQRGFALGVNQIAGTVGSIAGLVLGGVLAAVNWRWVFLVSVPIGLAGTVWAYLALREIGERRPQPLDLWGNLTFGLGLTALLVGLTYGLMPYGGAAMGWGNPWIRAALVLGALLLALFVWIEGRVPYPMFRLGLFRNRAFAAGNVSGFLASLARGGLQFMLIIWLQGVWLPLHGVPFDQTPLQAGIDTVPMMVGFVAAGPLSGALSDRYGARPFATGGMLLSALGFALLTTLPADFSYPLFAFYIFLLGVGMGLFASPNSSSIMNAVPPEHRGVASGMRATFQNAGQMMSMAVFFTIVIAGLGRQLPAAMAAGLRPLHLAPALAGELEHIPPLAALFSAILGYNPLGMLLPAALLHALPGDVVRTLLSERFFARLVAAPFLGSLRAAFAISVGLSLVAAVASLLRGQRYVWEEEASPTRPAALSGAAPAPEALGGERSAP